MRKPFIDRGGRLQRISSERGVTMLLVAVCMVAIIAMAALSIDVVTLYLAHLEAQRAADTAALAAARVISVSGITSAADPTTDTASWQSICGGSSSLAYLTAVAVAQANAVGGAAPTVTSVMFSAQGATGGAADCSTLGTAFAINPTVTVQVQSSPLPTLFSRMWSHSSNTPRATAAAEVFNPSNSGSIVSGGDAIPVVPRCVKPWVVPNEDPGSPGSPFVNKSTGQIQNPGIKVAGSGVIGENFALTSPCGGGANCSGFSPNPPNASAGVLYYVPALVNAASVAFPSCADDSLYQEAVGGCDVNTVYACGKSGGSQVDLTINPGKDSGDTAVGAKCLINDPGQDVADYTSFPFQITSGFNNPIVKNQLVSSSNSIVSLPIYDDTQGTSSPVALAGSQPTVTIVGFLQVFIDNVDSGTGNVNVHVLNVAGCGNNASTSSSAPGTSPVPIRLVTAQ